MMVRPVKAAPTPAVMKKASRVDSTHLGCLATGYSFCGWLVLIEQMNATTNVAPEMMMNAGIVMVLLLLLVLVNVMGLLEMVWWCPHRHVIQYHVEAGYYY